MVDVSLIGRLVLGVQRNVDISQNTLIVGSLKVGTSTPVELTKTIVTNLIALQNGSDFATGTNSHTHDGRYFTETELSSVTGVTGSDLIGDDNTYTNFTPTTTTIKGALAGIDSALSTGNGKVKVTAADTNADYLNNTITAGAGLSKSVTNPGGDETLDLAVNVDNSSIEINADTLRVKASGITNAMLAGSIDVTTKITGIVPVANGGTGVTVSSGASSVMLRDTNQNVAANNILYGYTTTVTAAGTTVLTVSSERTQYFTGTTTQTVTLPTTGVVAGQQYRIVNRSTGIVTVQSSGLNTVLAMSANTDVTFTALVATPTTAGNWDGVASEVVADASPTVSGIVNLTNQSFAGTKVFREGARGVNQQLAKSPTMARNLGLSPRPQAITVTTGSSPQRITTDGTSMWVACNSGTVTKINPRTQVVTATITPGGQPRYILFDGINIWAACGPNDFIKKINPNTNLVTATINFTAGNNPSGMAFDGTYLWVTRQGSNTIAKVDITTDTIIASVTVGNFPVNAEFDGTSIWVSNYGSGTVSKVDPVANSVLATVSVGSNPVGSVFDGRNLWVLSNAQSRIDRIDVNANVNLGNIAVGSNPEEVTTDGSFVYTANFSSNSVSKISIFTNAIVGTYTNIPNARGIIFDGSSHIWVTDLASTNVYVLPTYNA